MDNEAHTWTANTTRTLTALSRLVSDLVTLNRDYGAVVADLQQRLVPESLPAAPYGRLDGLYRAVPSPEAIGGDFYDAIVHDSGAIDLVVGDVVGHGVRSTQAAAQLKAGARALMHDPHLGPARMLEIVDRTVASLPGCDCAAMIAVRIDADGARVRWARAGAMPPLLLDDHAHIIEANPGPPLGRVGKRVECEIRLRPGHGIMFFTDGLVEQRTRFLDDRFVELQNSAHHATPLDALVSQMVGDDRDDDIAIVRYVFEP